mgnify:CR=1 FL=1
MKIFSLILFSLAAATDERKRTPLSHMEAVISDVDNNLALFDDKGMIAKKKEQYTKTLDVLRKLVKKYELYKFSDNNCWPRRPYIKNCWPRRPQKFTLVENRFL